VSEVTSTAKYDLVSRSSSDRHGWKDVRSADDLNAPHSVGVVDNLRNSSGDGVEEAVKDPASACGLANGRKSIPTWAIRIQT
jgi:hypothetical protein